MFSFKFVNSDEIQRALTGLQADLHESLKKSRALIADKLIKDARGALRKAGPNTPPRPGIIFSRTGRLASSLHSITVDTDPKQPSLIIEAQAPYSGFLEYGTTDISARNWLLKTLQSDMDYIESVLNRTVDNAVESF